MAGLLGDDSTSRPDADISPADCAATKQPFVVFASGLASNFRPPQQVETRFCLSDNPMF